MEEIKYDIYMDKECIPLCDVLNTLPDVTTTESCCGHLERPYSIWFKSTNPYSLALIARAFDRRYCGTEMLWRIQLETIDSESKPQYVYGIYSETPYSDYAKMIEDVNKLVENIEYWKQDEFKQHFKYIDYNMPHFIKHKKALSSTKKQVKGDKIAEHFMLFGLKHKGGHSEKQKPKK